MEKKTKIMWDIIKFSFVSYKQDEKTTLRMKKKKLQLKQRISPTKD